MRRNGFYEHLYSKDNQYHIRSLGKEQDKYSGWDVRIFTIIQFSFAFAHILAFMSMDIGVFQSMESQLMAWPVWAILIIVLMRAIAYNVPKLLGPLVKVFTTLQVILLFALVEPHSVQSFDAMLYSYVLPTLIAFAISYPSAILLRSKGVVR